MKERLSRGSSDRPSPRREIDMVGIGTSRGATSRSAGVIDRVWSGSYARTDYLKTLVRRRARILESGAARFSLKPDCP